MALGVDQEAWLQKPVLVVFVTNRKGLNRDIYTPNIHPQSTMPYQGGILRPTRRRNGDTNTRSPESPSAMHQTLAYKQASSPGVEGTKTAARTANRLDDVRLRILQDDNRDGMVDP